MRVVVYIIYMWQGCQDIDVLPFVTKTCIFFKRKTCIIIQYFRMFTVIQFNKVLGFDFFFYF